MLAARDKTLPHGAGMNPEPEDLPRPSWLSRVVLARVSKVRGAVLDFGRLLGGALQLNTRKTVWVWRGRRFNAPCQSESDSGRAGETRCDAANFWAERRRFRRICPHLRQQPDGEWRCGVDSVDVRVFWGRALAWWAGLLLALCIGVTLPVWAMLWKTGVRVSYQHVVWPGDWRQIRRERSRYYMQRAEQAMAGRRYDEMVISLQSALQSDPGNFTAHLYLANIAWVQGNYPVANERLGEMLRDFPGERVPVARAWLPKLLVLGDLPRVKELAAELLVQDADGAGPWAHALIFAARQTGDAAILTKVLQDRKVPEALRPVLAAQAAGIRDDRPRARQAFRALQPEGTLASFVAYQQVEGLLDYGAPEDAQALLENVALPLESSQRLYFRLRAGAQLGWEGTTAKIIRESFRGIDLAHLNAIALYLVRCHDRAGLVRVLDQMANSPRAEKLDGTFAMLYLAATLWGERDLLPVVARLAMAKSPLTPALLARFDQVALRPGAMGEAMGVLPLPLDAVYAAHAALHPKPVSRP